MARCMMIAAAVAALCAGSAQAQDLRELCADRPGLGTPSCTVDRGHVVAELGLADWTREDDGPVRTDSFVTGDLLLRVGLTDSIEAQIGWTAFGHERERDRVTGTISRSSGVGDTFLAVRANLRNPDSSGTSIAIMPYTTLPTGGQTIGAGDWSAGLLAPMSFDLGGLALELTPQIEAAVDQDRHGRHALYGGVAGLNFNLADQLAATAEVALHRDDDPAGPTTEALTGLSLAWQQNAGTQWDAGINLGLNRNSPGVELYAGIVRRF